jgi:hypothetical protein
MMKISLNRKISELNDEFHNGDLSLTDYRVKRRKELEALNSSSEPQLKHTTRLSKGPIKPVVLGTCYAVALLFVTVMIAKFFM